MLSLLIVRARGLEGTEIRGHGRWLQGMVSGQDFSSCDWANRLFLVASLLVSWGCWVDLFSSLLFFGTLSGLVDWLVFFLGLEWPLLCLGGSGVLSQGAGYGVLECVFLSFPEMLC